MKLFRNLGIVAIAIFSFFYTEKIANYMLLNNELYQEIEKEKASYEIKSVNAVIDGEYIVPGLNGLAVNVKDSYYNMKDIEIFNSYYLMLDTTYPDVSLNSNVDKIITRGNEQKQSVSFILEYDKEIIEFFLEYGYDASVLVDIDTFDKNSELEQINNEINEYNNLDSLINKYSNNSNVCYLNEKNEKLCKKKSKFLVKTNKILNDSTVIDIKNSIKSGDIYYVAKNTDVKNIQLIINSILYKDLDIVRISELISEEIWVSVKKIVDKKKSEKVDSFFWFLIEK